MNPSAGAVAQRQTRSRSALISGSGGAHTAEAKWAVYGDAFHAGLSAYKFGLPLPRSSEAHRFSYQSILTMHRLSCAAGALDWPMAKSEVETRNEGLDAATVEVLRREVRAGVAEAFAPLARLADALQRTMTKATETAAILQKRRAR